MKKAFFIIFTSLLMTQVSGQELLLSTKHSSSTLPTFSNSVGFDMRYSEITKSGNKIGLAIAGSYNPFNYDYIKITNADPFTFLVKEVQPESYLWSLQASYSFLRKENDNARFFIGPTVSLNYFRVNERIHRLASGFYTESTYTSNVRWNNKLGLGFLIEYQVNDKLLKRHAVIYTINPSIGSYEVFPAMGSMNPWFYLSIDFKIGVCFNFEKQK